MDQDIIEIDQLEPGRVVLVIPARHLIVIGRTLDEARRWAQSALMARGIESVSRGRSQLPPGAAAPLGDDSPVSSAA